MRKYVKNEIGRAYDIIKNHSWGLCWEALKKCLLCSFLTLVFLFTNFAGLYPAYLTVYAADLPNWASTAGFSDSNATWDSTTGTLTLINDVYISNPIDPSNRVIIDLNNHFIRTIDSYTESSPMIKVSHVSTDLTITDNSSRKLGYISNANNNREGCVTINGGSFTLNGGQIAAFRKSGNGGGVYVASGTFTMNGGTISSCYAEDGHNGNGGGVYVSGGTFTMNGGTISSCHAYRGGGVFVAPGCTFEMNGGTISGCRAGDGSGGSGVCVYTPAVFDLKGGTVIGTIRGTIHNADEVANITFNPNGGEGSMDPIYVKKGSNPQLTKNTFEYTGKNFDGWKDANNNPYSDEARINNIQSNLELKAQWSDPPVTYSVTMTNDGNGTASASPASGTTNTEVTITASPTGGYHFKKWQVEEGGVTLSSTTTNPATFSIGTADVEIKAIFEQNAPGTYSVTMTNDGNGTASASPASGTTNTEVTITASPTGGYHFKKWQVEEGGVTLSSTTTNPATFNIRTANVRIKAIFEQNAPGTYSVTMTNDGNGTASASPASGTTNTEVTITASPTGGYHFKKWQVEEGGVTLSSTTTNPATFSIGTADVEIKAIFEKDSPVVETCTISFDKNGGKGDMNPQTVDKGTSTKLKKNKFTREGYAFDSWNTQADGKGKSYKDKDEITVEEDTTLYAQWKEGEPEPEDDDDDDDDHHSDHTPPSWVLNPNVFFASPFWKKLQSKNGQPCMSKKDKVARIPGTHGAGMNPLQTGYLYQR